MTQVIDNVVDIVIKLDEAGQLFNANKEKPVGELFQEIQDILGPVTQGLAKVSDRLEELSRSVPEAKDEALSINGDVEKAMEIALQRKIARMIAQITGA